MSHTSELKVMTAFAAEYGLHRATVGDIVEFRKLPYVQIGMAKGLPAETQRTILQVMDIKPSRELATAS